MGKIVYLGEAESLEVPVADGDPIEASQGEVTELEPEVFAALQASSPQSVWFEGEPAPSNRAVEPDEKTSEAMGAPAEEEEA